MRELHFHIGPHKTATTRIQNLLQRHETQLACQGIGYIGVLAFRETMFGIVRDAALGRRERDQAIRDIRACMDRDIWNRDRLIISFENISGGVMHVVKPGEQPPYSPVDARLRIMAEAFRGTKTRIFCAIRNYAPFFASAYSQHIRNGGVESAAELEVGLRDTHLRWPAYVERIKAAWPGAEIVLWDQGDYRDNENTVLSALAFDQEVPPVAAETVHASLSAPGAEALRAMWPLFGKINFNKTVRIARAMDRALPTSAGYPGITFFGEEMNDILNMRFREDVMALRAMSGVRFLL